MKYRMKSIVVIIIFLNTFLLSGQGEQLFDNNFVHEIKIEIDDVNFWQTLTSNYDLNYPNIPYALANVEIDGSPIDSIGIRLKGFASYFGVETDKKSIKLDFNEFISGQKYDGLKKINLNNGEGDPTLQRDFICYDIFRNAGIGAPRTSYAKVYLNNEYWGLYVLVEQVDRTFLKNNFEEYSGNLFKNMGNSNLEWLGSDTTTYQFTFDLKTNNNPSAWPNFINLIDVINNSSDIDFKESINSVFDVNRYLKILAIDIATNNWDSYIEHGRNFYLYQDTVDNKFKWIPWDYNFALGGTFSSDFFEEGIDIDSIEITIEDPSACNTIINGSSPYPVTDSVFIFVINSDPFCCEYDWDEACQSNYELIEDQISMGDSLYMTNDTATIETASISQSFQINMSDSEKTLIKRLLEVSEFRKTYYKSWCNLLDGNFTADRILPIIDSNTDMIRDAIYSDTNYMWETDDFEADLLDGTERVTGIKRYFNEMPDLLKGDLASNFDCSSLESQNEFNDIVINEFMASNDSLSGIADHNGQYEDWIELYNNTDENIDLSNAYLSDSRDTPKKWAFPSESLIEAGGYLIVWADNDEAEQGLHTNFKLAKDGGFILLTDGNQVLDSLEYGEQNRNLSMARIPNGTGNYVIQEATFRFNNEESTSTNHESNVQSLVSVFPNPVSDILNIEVPYSIVDKSLILINNSMGQNLLSQNISTQKSSIDISKLNSGLFNLLIKNEKGIITSITKFLVIQN